jgi:hypothetical protein
MLYQIEHILPCIHSLQAALNAQQHLPSNTCNLTATLNTYCPAGLSDGNCITDATTRSIIAAATGGPGSTGGSGNSGSGGSGTLASYIYCNVCILKTAECRIKVRLWYGFGEDNGKGRLTLQTIQHRIIYGCMLHASLQLVLACKQVITCLEFCTGTHPCF